MKKQEPLTQITNVIVGPVERLWNSRVEVHVFYSLVFYIYKRGNPILKPISAHMSKKQAERERQLFISSLPQSDFKLHICSTLWRVAEILGEHHPGVDDFKEFMPQIVKRVFTIWEKNKAKWEGEDWSYMIRTRGGRNPINNKDAYGRGML